MSFDRSRETRPGGWLTMIYRYGVVWVLTLNKIVGVLMMGWYAGFLRKNNL